MADDPCANRILPGDGTATSRQLSMRRQHLRLASGVRLPALQERRSGDTRLLALGNQYPRSLPGRALCDFQNLAVAESPTGSCLARSLSLGQGGQFDVLVRGAAPCPPGKLQRTCSNYRRREFRAHPSSGMPCTFGRSNGVSYRATFGIRGRLYPPVCGRALKGCYHLYLLLGF